MSKLSNAIPVVDVFAGPGGLIDLWKLTIEAYKVYFSDFFGGASDLLGSLGANVKSGSQEK